MTEEKKQVNFAALSPEQRNKAIANLQRKDITRSGDKPQIHFDSSYYAKSVVSDTSNARKTVMNEIKKMVEQGGADVNIAEHIGSVRTFSSHTQRTVEAYDYLFNAANEGKVHLGIDIENIGNLAGRGQADFLGITEIGMSKWSVKDGLFGFAGGGDRRILALQLGDDVTQKVEGLIKKVKDGKKLNPDEYRSLHSLTRYADEAIFETSKIGGLDISVMNPTRLADAKMPMYGANLKAHEQLIRSGLNNLNNKGNSLDVTIKALNAYVENVATSGGGMFGYNILDHDVPAILSYLEGNRTHAQGKLIQDVDQLTGRIRSIVGGASGQAKALDIFNLVQAVFPNTSVEMAEIARNAGAGDTAIKKYLHGKMAGSNKSGFLTMEKLAGLFGLGAYTHVSVEDVTRTGELLNMLNPSIQYKIDKAIGRGTTGRYNTGELVLRRKSRLSPGTPMYSVRGVHPKEADLFSGVLKRLEDGSFVDAYGAGNTRGQVYKGMSHNFVGTQFVKSLEGFENGAWVTMFHNTVDNVYPYFVTPENISGTGIDTVRNIVHRSFIPQSANTAMGLDAAGATAAYDVKMRERATRGYSRMFEYGGYDRAVKWYGTAAAVQDGTMTLQDALGSLDSDIERRNFQSVLSRLKAENQFMQPFLAAIKDEDIRIKSAAMSNMKNFLDGKIGIDGVFSKGQLKKNVGVYGHRWNRSLTIQGVGDLNVGTLESTKSGLHAIISKTHVVSVLQEMQSKGLLTPNEVAEFKAAFLPKGSSVLTDKNAASEALAHLIYNKSTAASEILGNVSGRFLLKPALISKARDLGYEGKAAGSIANMASMMQRFSLKTADSPYVVPIQGINNIITSIVADAKSRINPMKFSGNVDISRDEKIIGMLGSHERLINDQMSRFTGLTNRVAHKSAQVRIESLISGLNSVEDSQVAVKLMTGYEQNSLYLVAHHQQHSKAFSGMTAAEIMADERAVAMQIPLLNKNGTLTVGKQQLINMMFLGESQATATKGMHVLSSGFDKILNEYNKAAGSISRLINEGDIEEARRRVRTAKRRATEDLAGFAGYKTLEEARHAPNADIFVKKNTLVVEEGLAKKLMNAFGKADKRNLFPGLASIGIKDTNAYGVKESQFSKGYVVSTYEARKLIPFGDFSSMSNQRQVQQFGALPVNTNVPAAMLNPLLATSSGLEKYGYREGINPFITMGVGYMDDVVLAAATEQAGLNLAIPAQTYDARGIMKRSAAEMYGYNIYEQYTVDQTDLKKGSILKKGDVIGKLTSGATVDELGNVLDEGLVKSVSTYNKYGNGEVQGLRLLDNGKMMVDVKHQLEVNSGMKMTLSNGEKLTVTLIDDADWNKMFGEKLGNQLGMVMENTAIKHREYGSIMASNIRFALNEVHKTFTVGSEESRKAQMEVSSVLNSFFKTHGFSFDSVNGQPVLVVPDKLAMPKNMGDFHDQVLGGIDSRLGTNIRSKMVQNVGGYDVLLGVENVGRKLDEIWYKASGFKDDGLVKYGPREVEMLGIHVLGSTGDDLDLTYKHYKGLINKQLQKNKKNISKYVSSLGSIIGRVDADAPLIRTTGMAQFGSNEFALSSLSPLPEFHPDDVITKAHYRNTWFDVLNPGMRGSDPGSVTAEIAKNISQRGGAYLELPMAVKLHKDAAATDRVFLPYASLKKIQGADGYFVDELGSAASGMLRSVYDYQQTIIGGNKKEIAAAEESIRSAGLRYGENILKAFSSKGSIVQDMLSVKLKGSGQFRVQSTSPIPEFVDGRRIAENTAFVHEERFHEMIKDMPEKQRLAMIEKATSGEGVLALVNRYPTIYPESVSPVRLMVNNNVVGHKTNIALTVGSSIKWAADNDGDYMSVVLSHYKDKTVEQIKNETHPILAEMNKFQAASRGELEELYDVIKGAYVKDATANRQKLTLGTWVKEIMSNSDTMFDAIRVTPGMGIEELEARASRELIGFYSNINTKMRRTALAAFEGGGISRLDAMKVANLGALMEQSPISAKHFTSSSLKSAADDLIKKSAEEGSVLGFDDALRKVYSERINLGVDFKQALLENDKEKFKKVANLLGGIDVESSTMEEMRSSNIKTSLKVRQNFTFEEMWSSLGKLNKVSGGIRNVLGSDQYKLFTALSQSLDPYAVMNSLEQGSSVITPEILKMAQNVLGIEGLDSNADIMAKNSAFTPKEYKAAGKAFEGAADLTVGDMPFINILRTAGEGGNALGSMKWGAAAFAGMMMVTNSFSDPLPKDMMPRADEAPPVDGRQIPIPTGNQGTNVARVIPEGSGYENLQVNIKARNVRRMTDDQISQLIQNNISRSMPPNMNMNVRSTDNSERIDQMWVQDVVANAINKGMAF